MRRAMSFGVIIMLCKRSKSTEYIYKIDIKAKLTSFFFKYSRITSTCTVRKLKYSVSVVVLHDNHS